MSTHFSACSNSWKLLPKTWRAPKKSSQFPLILFRLSFQNPVEFFLKLCYYILRFPYIEVWTCPFQLVIPFFSSHFWYLILTSHIFHISSKYRKHILNNFEKLLKVECDLYRPLQSLGRDSPWGPACVYHSPASLLPGASQWAGQCPPL